MCEGRDEGEWDRGSEGEGEEEEREAGSTREKEREAGSTREKDYIEVRESWILLSYGSIPHGHANAVHGRCPRAGFDLPPILRTLAMKAAVFKRQQWHVFPGTRFWAGQKPAPRAETDFRRP